MLCVAQIIIAARNAKVVSSLLHLLRPPSQGRQDGDEVGGLQDQTEGKEHGRVTTEGVGCAQEHASTFAGIQAKGAACGAWEEEMAGRPASIGVMYGALHLDDLLNQMRAAGLYVRQPERSDEGSPRGGFGRGGAEADKGEGRGSREPDVGWNVAWSMRNSNFNDVRVMWGTAGPTWFRISVWGLGSAPWV